MKKAALNIGAFECSTRCETFKTGAAFFVPREGYEGNIYVSIQFNFSTRRDFARATAACLQL
jgi:hypothetical protein